MEWKKNGLIFLLSLFLYFIHFFAALGYFKRSTVGEKPCIILLMIKISHIWVTSPQIISRFARLSNKLAKMRLFWVIFTHCENLFILLQNWLLLGFLLPLQTYLALIQVNLSYLLSKGQSLPLMYGLWGIWNSSWNRSRSSSHSYSFSVGSLELVQESK